MFKCFTVFSKNLECIINIIRIPYPVPASNPHSPDLTPPPTHWCTHRIVKTPKNLFIKNPTFHLCHQQSGNVKNWNLQVNSMTWTHYYAQTLTRMRALVSIHTNTHPRIHTNTHSRIHTNTHPRIHTGRKQTVSHEWVSYQGEKISRFPNTFSAEEVSVINPW